MTTTTRSRAHPRGLDRRTSILRLLASDGEVGVDDLAERLDVTASTIRRDLARMTAEGTVTRTLGGAVVGVSAAEESPLHARSRLFRERKDAIGHWAASQIQDGETVLLDAGTTVGRVAHHLRGRNQLTVITNGLTSIIELADADDISLIVLGGEFRHISHGLVGAVTEMNARRIWAHRVFLGADGLTADRGICEANSVQTMTKEAMASRGDHIYVLADSSKLGQTPFSAWAPLELPWTLVTDAGATDEQLAPFRAIAHIEVVVVPVSGNADDDE